ncbi:electron transfer flavoprotein subunit alpha/FixB family protein [Aquirufa regiilacus]
MKNIAAFIEIKEGKLSPRSKQIIHLIQDIQQKHNASAIVTLFTFDQVNKVELPALSNVKLYSLTGTSETGLLSKGQIDTILALISDASNACVIGYKSSLIDAILSSTAIRFNLKVFPQVISIDVESDQFALKQSIFSGKALTYLHVSHTAVLQLNPAFEFASTTTETSEQISEVVTLVQDTPHKIVSVDKVAQGANLADANFVVGAGRGLKDPTNWGMIESLASKIGAATACSKPVSDINWRPHSEHVGQTGIKIAPQLYIACGISGAIQHLAGVNGSKTIIVINNDPEAPFFKYADYGIVGDVFDIVPEIVKNI